MYKGQRIAVVVPAYNEERWILSVIQTMPDFVDHIIVVDDCSTDATYQVVANARDSRTTLLMNARNKGVGGATIAGYREAQGLGCDIIVKMDGDGQMRPECLETLLEPVACDGYAYSKG